MSFLTFSVDIADKNANATYLTVALASGTIAVTDTDAGIDNNHENDDNEKKKYRLRQHS